MQDSLIITALDLGTTKIVAVIAEVDAENKINVKGVGESVAYGLENGLIKDMKKASDSIRTAVEIAEKIAGIEAENIYAGISGEHIDCCNADGSTSIDLLDDNEAGEVSEEYIKRAIEDAKRNVGVQQQANKNIKIMHCIPQLFEVDNQKKILNPLNMTGYHLGVCTHVITADKNAVANIEKCIEMAGFKAHEIVVGQVAATEAVLSEDEKTLGCVLLDIGGGTIDLSFYCEQYLHYTAVIPFGGRDIDKDLSAVLCSSIADAEVVKTEKGKALGRKVTDNDEIKVSGVSGRSSSIHNVRFITDIIEVRMRKMFETAYNSIKENYESKIFLAGLTLTGGSALLSNIDELAEEVFNMRTTIGYPDISGLRGATGKLENPVYTVSVGLLYYAGKNLPASFPDSVKKKSKNSNGFFRLIKEIFLKIIHSV